MKKNSWFNFFANASARATGRPAACERKLTLWNRPFVTTITTREAFSTMRSTAVTFCSGQPWQAPRRTPAYE